jgi:predicted nucleotidyltransferase
MDTMKGRGDRELIDRIKKGLAPLLSEEGLRLIVLFGSLATGKEHSGSDVDLGFLFDGAVDLVDLTNKR